MIFFFLLMECDDRAVQMDGNVLELYVSLLYFFYPDLFFIFFF